MLTVVCQNIERQDPERAEAQGEPGPVDSAPSSRLPSRPASQRAGRRGGRPGSPGSHSPVTPPPFSSGRPGGSGRSLSAAGEKEGSEGRVDPKGSEPAERPSRHLSSTPSSGAQNQVRGAGGGAAGAPAPAGQGAGNRLERGIWRPETQWSPPWSPVPSGGGRGGVPTSGRGGQGPPEKTERPSLATRLPPVLPPAPHCLTSRPPLLTCGPIP